MTADWAVTGSIAGESTDGAGGAGRAATGNREGLDDRLDTVGWGLVFLLFAVLAMPSGTATYAFAAGVGALMLGLNALRFALGVPVRSLSLVLGAATLAAAIGALAGVGIDAFVVFFVLLGLATIAGAVLRPD